ncbi:MAG: RnfABCDGE type electron transport complex subunit D [Cyanobacteria bacterium P01_D01_bin.156]
MDISKVRLSHLPLPQDARDYQILCLSLFLGLGVAMRDWSLQPAIVATAILTALVTQGMLSWLSSHKGLALYFEKVIHGFPFRSGTAGEGARYLEQTVAPPLPATPPLLKRRTFNWRSPLITALGLSLLLRTDHMATMAFAASIAIASKFLFKANNKHFFNPANLGIIAALTLTNDAWVSPGQWGDEIWYAFIFIGAGGIVLKRVGRWDTTGMFLVSYALLEAVRNLYLGWTWDVWAHRMTSGSLLLFALFMVTDPRSIPNARPARLFWALAIAVLTFVLRNQFYLSTAVFWALFLLAPLTIVLDKLWKSPRFDWKKKETLVLTS